MHRISVHWFKLYLVTGGRIGDLLLKLQKIKKYPDVALLFFKVWKSGEATFTHTHTHTLHTDYGIAIILALENFPWSQYIIYWCLYIVELYDIMIRKTEYITQISSLILGCYGVPSHEIHNEWLCSRCKTEAWTAVSFTYCLVM